MSKFHFTLTSSGTFQNMRNKNILCTTEQRGYVVTNESLLYPLERGKSQFSLFSCDNLTRLIITLLYVMIIHTYIYRAI